MFSFPDFNTTQWILLVVVAFAVGLSKAGLSGISMVSVLTLAHIFSAQPRLSTGVLLLQLLVADVAAVWFYHYHASWKQIWRVWPSAFLGVVLGWWAMGSITNENFKPVLGWMIVGLIVLQVARKRLGAWVERVELSRPFAWVMGLLGGTSTMIANAAGPVMNLYFLAVRLPKMEMVATSAWFFFLLNLSKVPFSSNLGLQPAWAYGLALVLLPVTWLGVWLGKDLVQRIPQQVFETLILIFAAAGALRLLLG